MTARVSVPRDRRGEKRNVECNVAQLRALLGPLVRDGREVEAAQVRRELAEAKFWSDLDRLAAAAPPLSAAQQKYAARRLATGLAASTTAREVTP